MGILWCPQAPCPVLHSCDPRTMWIKQGSSHQCGNGALLVEQWHWCSCVCRYSWQHRCESCAELLRFLYTTSYIRTRGRAEVLFAFATNQKENTVGKRGNRLLWNCFVSPWVAVWSEFYLFIYIYIKICQSTLILFKFLMFVFSCCSLSCCCHFYFPSPWTICSGN